jgi:phosphoadenosine phosphosulfate reductase
MDAALLARALAPRLHRTSGMTPIERAGYLAHAARPAFQRRVAAALELIAAHRGYCVSTSWGKDSVVLAHLCVTACRTMPIVNLRYPNPAERIADEDRVRDETLALEEFSKAIYLEETTPGEWEMFERAGSGFSEAQTAEQRQALAWWAKEYDAAAKRVEKRARAAGTLIGICKEESVGRRLNLRTRGLSYEKKDGRRIAAPLGDWRADDIWAYLVSRGLPWLRLYDLATRGRKVTRSGIAFAAGAGGVTRAQGVWEDWRRVYPVEFGAWMRRFPELDR